MFIPDEIRKSTFFIGFVLPAGKFVPMGTGFLVGLPTSDGQHRATIPVTARHVLSKTEAAIAASGGTMVLRFNTRDGQMAYVETSPDAWLPHPDDEGLAPGVFTVDVAACLWQPESAGNALDFLTWPLEACADSGLVSAHGLGAGEDVFMAGLFINHVGKQRNIPIIRVGTIAAMAEEQIPTPRFGLIDAHLIEVRSIGGFSGSPVFLQMGNLRSAGGNISLTAGPPPIYLLGLMHGFFGVEAEETALAEAAAVDQLNSGIAAVVPVEKIIETLHHPKIEALMGNAEKALQAQRGPIETVSIEADKSEFNEGG